MKEKNLVDNKCKRKEGGIKGSGGKKRKICISLLDYVSCCSTLQQPYSYYLEQLGSSYTMNKPVWVDFLKNNSRSFSPASIIVMMAKTTSWKGFFPITDSLGKALTETTANESLLPIKAATATWKEKITVCGQL